MMERQNMGIRLTLAVLLCWATGCGINTEPIPAQDGGIQGVDRGGDDTGSPAENLVPDGGAPAPPDSEDPLAFPTEARFETCDVDLSCTPDCADDLDCQEAFSEQTDGARQGPTFEEAFPTPDDSQAMEAQTQMWVQLPTMEGDVAVVGFAQVADGSRLADERLVLGVYAADETMVGRTGPVPTMVMMDIPETAGAWLRVVWTGAEPTEVYLRLMEN
jgi:hypothetical protein